nr:hypothetical protein [Frigoribacterium sp. VKM Ac-2530]
MVEDATQHQVDLLRCQAGAGGGDVAEGVMLADDRHGADLLLDAPPARQDRHGVHLERAEPHLGEERLGVVGEVGHVREVVGHVRLTTEDATAPDRHLLPRLGVDDVDARGADDDEVDLGTAAAASRPGSVGQERVANCGERGEDAGDTAFRDACETEARCSVAVLSCCLFMRLRACQPTTRFVACGCSCCGHVVPPRSGRVWSGRGL